MLFSTHYYVLSLGAERSVLYEAFRDGLIEVENQGFPVRCMASESTIEPNGARHALMRRVDECFDSYDSRERLGLVLVGDTDLLSAFDAVTTHGSAVVGRVNGDHTTIGPGDLGQMVWPVVKEGISAVSVRAMRDLDDCSREGRVVEGLADVVTAASEGRLGTLLVEEDFRVRGSLASGAQPPVVSADVDIRDLNDDAVDAVIEQVLGSGGNVVFMRSGTLTGRGRIALLIQEAKKP